MDNLETLHRNAHEKRCTSDHADCYIGTCPVNTVAFLLNEHKDRPWMIFGLIKYIEWLAK